jgi:uncharacterized membrane protein YdbT with pleckstrin-like domain
MFLQDASETRRFFIQLVFVSATSIIEGVNNMQSFKPSPQYLNKLRLGLTLVALIILLSIVLIVGLVSLDPEVGAGELVLIVLLAGVADLVWWAPSLILAQAYFNSLSYEIHSDEVIVHAGIWTKSVKHVPFRTVTNLQVNRDIFDRWFFNIGSLNIQTAGMSGTTGAEENLVGLPNVDEVYDLVATQLRRFRGAMAPTASEQEEIPAAPGSSGVAPEAVGELLAEVRAIRQMLQERQ